MRKRTVPLDANEALLVEALSSDARWLNVDTLATVEITSEDSAHPIESALLPGRAPGWRAAGPGEQTIRLLFDLPQRLCHIHMQFSETGRERTQEYVLRWSPDHGRSYREIVRQQWNFHPHGSTIETEDHRVELQDVTILELNIVPDIAGGNAVASLAQLRLG
ncbi:hypothetical protein W02_09710 [Nitrospira sp. KM1]|uniref:hypothetical protein n=1 Tax=Nitrospira sp. KM1 TaxID=1936990 RepID=UPI0013A775A0|nr:hypothetical protein [Nitrospira sp. KM1]BCA53831.1 hypothetical protein W02_09710 [Nitrospira sp. KM1]